MKRTTIRAIFAAIFIIYLPNSYCLQEPFALIIQHESQDEKLTQTLKDEFTLCVEYTQALKKVYVNAPDKWNEIKNTILVTNPEFDITRELSEPLNFDKLAVKLETEYFYGNKYARDTTVTDYKVIDDGSCHVEIEKRHTGVIDNGSVQYIIDYDYKVAEQRNSFGYMLYIEMPNSDYYKSADEKDRNDIVQNVLLEINRELKIPLLLGEHENSELERYLDQDLTCLKEYKDYQKICYWKNYASYPALLHRPIVLKIQKNENDFLYQRQAMDIQVKDQLDARHFRLPEDIRLLQ